MQTYSALAAEHIQAVAIPRGLRYASARSAAPKLHAMVFGIIETKASNILGEDFDRENLHRLALAQAVYMRDKRQFGFIGMFLTTAILSWLMGKLVDMALDWLISEMQEWINRNRATGTPFGVSVGRARLMADLVPIFDGAREVLAW